jgi:hypothetical protein
MRKYAILGKDMYILAMHYFILYRFITKTVLNIATRKLTNYKMIN